MYAWYVCVCARVYMYAWYVCVWYVCGIVCAYAHTAAYVADDLVVLSFHLYISSED